MFYGHPSGCEDPGEYEERTAAWERYLARLHEQQRFEEMDVDTSKYYESESRFLKAQDLLGKDGRSYAELRLKISNVFEEEIKDDVSGEVRMKLSVEFTGKKKLILLNATNFKVLQGAFGMDTDSWIGQEVTLFVDPYVQYAGKTTPGLRLRAASPVNVEELPF